MIVLMDPMEDPDDILRANRSRERQFVFDMVFDAKSTQVNNNLFYIFFFSIFQSKSGNFSPRLIKFYC